MMWRELLNGLLPDSTNLLPPAIQADAARRIRQYWQSRGWQLVLGQVVLWAAAVYQQTPYAWAYGVLAGAIGFTYLVGCLGRYTVFWLLCTIAIFSLQGLVINDLGGVTALTTLIPYTISAMLLSGRDRSFVQMGCILAFWGVLIFEVIDFSVRLSPSRSIHVSYNILLAAFTFQTLRFLSHLTVDMSTAHVAEEMRLQSQHFLARVSHELRTPLNSVLGFAYLLRRSPMAETPQSYLTQIIEEGEHLNRLVGDLLDRVRLATGEFVLDLKPCDLNRLCQIAVDELRLQVSDGVQLSVSLDETLPTVFVDHLRLRQVITNLLSNAIKYTTAGQITVRTYAYADRVCIEFQDTGMGIPEAQRHLVFVAFVRLQTDLPGTGLGLDIALQIVQLHGGNIDLVSEVGVGSTFTMVLPVAEHPISSSIKPTKTPSN